MSAKPPASSVPTKSASGASRSYLLLYNAVSFTLWSIIAARLFLYLPAAAALGSSSSDGGGGTRGLALLYDAIFPLLLVTQTLALLEIGHAAVGMVRASVVTTLMQVASRIVVVWGVMWLFGGGRGTGPGGMLGTGAGTGKGSGSGNGLADWGFVGCVAAWGVTECVRYGYFMMQIWGKGVPGWVSWLRYNMFFVLYPIGISSECLLMYLALKPAPLVHPLLPWVFKAILMIYVPGSYILYSHMMAQRRKVMRAAVAHKSK